MCLGVLGHPGGPRFHQRGEGSRVESVRTLLDAREIPFGFAQGRLSLRLKNGYGQDDPSDRGRRMSELSLHEYRTASPYLFRSSAAFLRRAGCDAKLGRIIGRSAATAGSALLCTANEPAAACEVSTSIKMKLPEFTT